MNFYQTGTKSRFLAAFIGLCIFAAGFFATGEAVSAADQGTGAGAASAERQDPPVLIVSGKDAKKGDGFQGNYKYLTQMQLNQITDETRADLYFPSEKRDTYVDRAVYSARTKAEKGGWGLFSVSGIDLAAVADSLGINPEQNMAVCTQAKDGYTGTANNILTQQRYSFSDEQASAGSPVAPVIALEWKKISNLPSLEVPHFIFGQLDTGDYNMQSWVKGVRYIWLGDKETALSLDINGQSKKFTLAEIIGTKLGTYTSEYRYTEGGQQVTVKAQGVPLDAFLKDAGVQGKAAVKTSSGKVLENPSDYFLAYDGKLPDGTRAKAAGQLVLYGPGETKEEAAENVTGLQVSLSVPDQVKGLTAAALSYNSVKLTWKKVQGAESYNIYRSQNNGKSYQLHDCVEGENKTAYTDRNLKTGLVYSYRVKACVTVAGKDLEGAFSNGASAKPALGRTSVKKLSKSGKDGIKATWSRVSGANGYQVKIGTNKAVTKKVKTFKTTGNAGTAKTVTKLKKGTSYYVKVRPYRTVSNKTVYGPYSQVKSIKR